MDPKEIVSEDATEYTDRENSDLSIGNPVEESDEQPSDNIEF